MTPLGVRDVFLFQDVDFKRLDGCYTAIARRNRTLLSGLCLQPPSRMLRCTILRYGAFWTALSARD